MLFHVHAQLFNYVKKKRERKNFSTQQFPLQPEPSRAASSLPGIVCASRQRQTIKGLHQDLLEVGVQLGAAQVASQSAPFGCH